MKMQTLIVPAEWKAVDEEEDNVLEGYASTFDNIDLHYDVVAAGAFKNTIPRVLKGEVPYLADHYASVRNVLGTLVGAEEDNKGLKIRVKFATDPDTQAIRQKMIDGHIKKMSIGYEPLQWRYETRGSKRVRVLEEVKLWEVSAVVFPANPSAVIQRVKSAVAETVETVVQGAVVCGADETEVKAALAEWMNTAALGGVPGLEQPATREQKDSSTQTTHLETGDAGKPEGAEPQQDPKGPDALTLLMHKADAVLAGRDPDAVVDPVQYAGTSARLDALSTWLERSNREAELADQLRELRGR
ncbi:HK97 family phage prohead protease [Streptomyces sp. DH37]|uniref:HK97 family phage prohead protease n=1 Tax=Streptomyces sp. DH37 TaxID=3040122 RepID=UPI0024416EA9|nr:HK97 family phage prohead protease [Streptomyces sp. DH37]MDG9703806.1 HK97 family phage prohead protease [Streptomyces sp. DH37]